MHLPSCHAPVVASERALSMVHDTRKLWDLLSGETGPNGSDSDLIGACTRQRVCHNVCASPKGNLCDPQGKPRKDPVQTLRQLLCSTTRTPWQQRLKPSEPRRKPSSKPQNKTPSSSPGKPCLQHADRITGLQLGHAAVGLLEPPQEEQSSGSGL